LGVKIRKAEGSYSAYAAAKEAMRGFTRAAARDWGKYKINVNVICPAAMTERMASAWKEYPPEVQQKVLSRAAIPRWGDPERDIGRAAIFLASEDSDYITGHTLMVDGGIYML
jgi:NAD(P)-dependent dehydrogenase (short-subunit alcohol dehydrogenase family)